MVAHYLIWRIFVYAKNNNKFYPFVEVDKDLHDKISEDMTGGPSIVFTRKTVVGQTKHIFETQKTFTNKLWV